MGGGGRERTRPEGKGEMAKRSIPVLLFPHFEPCSYLHVFCTRIQV